MEWHLKSRNPELMALLLFVGLISWRVGPECDVILQADPSTMPVIDWLLCLAAPFCADQHKEPPMFLQVQTGVQLALYKQWKGVSASDLLSTDAVPPVLVGELFMDIGFPACERAAAAQKLCCNPLQLLLEAALAARHAEDIFRQHPWLSAILPAFHE